MYNVISPDSATLMYYYWLFGIYTYVRVYIWRLNNSFIFLWSIISIVQLKQCNVIYIAPVILYIKRVI